MTLGERLRGLREDHDLRQIDVAQQIKVLQASLSNYELDINQPDLSTLVKLANFYHVNIDYLLGNTDVKTSWKDYTAVSYTHLQVRLAPAVCCLIPFLIWHVFSLLLVLFLCSVR